MTASRASCIVVVLLFAPSFVGLARAQEAQVSADQRDEQQAVVRALFEEGVAFSDRGRWAEAADRFRRAMALRRLPVIVHNLAVALSRMGRPTEASELFRAVVRDSTSSAAVREAAQRELEGAVRRIGHLTIALDGDPAGVEVTLDGEPVPEALLDVSRPVDPGRHEIVALRGRTRVGHRTVTVTEGGASSVTLSIAAPDSLGEIDEGTGGRHRRGETGSSGSVLGRWWFWTAVGVVVVGAGATAFALSQGGGESHYEGNFTPGSLRFP